MLYNVCMKLSAEETSLKLKELEGWELKDNSIVKTFEFEDFMESVDCVNKIAPLAEGMSHHPDIEIKYNKVTIALSTHDEGGVTEKDFELASKIENLK